MKIAWGIVGAAAIAGKVVQSIQESNTGEVAAIASRDIMKAKEFATEHSIQTYYDNYDALIKNDMIKAIYIPLPNHLHKDWTIKAAKAGKHILCEKPFALTVTESQEMFEAGDKQQVKVMEAFMYRFDPRIERIKKILAEGILGEIKNIQFTFAHPLEEKFEQTNNYRLYREAGGGALYDIGVYGLNLVNYLLDGAQVEIISVKAIKENAKDIDRSIIVLLRYDKKVMVTITASFQFLGNYLTIAGTEGSIEVSNIISQEAGELRLRKLGSKELSIDHIPAFNSYTAMIDHFDDCIMNNKQLQVTKKQTLAVIDLVEKILDIVERDT